MFDPTKSLSVKPPKKPKGLSTVQYALLVEALAEGQIEGFPAPVAENFKLGSFNYNQAAKKNIFFNGTPILRPSADLSVFDEDGLVDIDDGEFNFKAVNDYKYREILINRYDGSMSIEVGYTNDDNKYKIRHNYKCNKAEQLF